MGLFRAEPAARAFTRERALVPRRYGVSGVYGCPRLSTKSLQIRALLLSSYTSVHGHLPHVIDTPLANH
jgi:hypothetical protein